MLYVDDPITDHASFYPIFLGFSLCCFNLNSRITSLTEKLVTDIRTTHQAVAMLLVLTNTYTINRFQVVIRAKL